MNARSGHRDETTGRRRWQGQASACRPARGGGRGPHRRRKGLVGGRVRMGGARPEEADPTERISDSNTWLLSSAPQRVDRGPGKGWSKDRLGAGHPSHLPPPGRALAGTQRRSRRPGPASSAAPFRVTPRAQARRAATGPTAAHSPARQRPGAQAEHA